MAPQVCLPFSGSTRLDFETLSGDAGKKCWADLEDTYTPSPWAEYPGCEQKMWPPTPTTPLPDASGLLQLPCVPAKGLAPALAQNGTAITAWPETTSAVAAPEVAPAPPDAAYFCCPEWPTFQLPDEALAMSTAADWSSVDSQDTTASAGESMQSRHDSGQCRPCAWFWRPQGCRNADACGYCHLCPEGELKARKKEKITAMRMGVLTPVKDKAQAKGGWGLKLNSLLQEPS